MYEYKFKKDYESICREIANTILSYDETSSLLSLKEIQKIIKLKSSNYRLPSIPKYSDILKFVPNNSRYRKLLRVKPVKTQSGIAVVTVMPMPFDCPHGRCIYCPGGKESNTPLSYIGTEPSTKIAQKVKYDAYEQVRTKIIQLMDRGHEVSKVELVIVGGTFPFYPVNYQIEFSKKCFDALNSFDDTSKEDNKHFNICGKMQDIGKTIDIQESMAYTKWIREDLQRSKKKNETSSVRCVGFTIETKPDYCKQEHVNLMLELGTTRIELGVQALDDKVYKKINRGHNLNDVYEAFNIARNSGYKIGAHMMPGLPGSTYEKDISDTKRLFEDDRLKPDMLKIYPTLVIPNTGLYELYKKNKYQSYSTEDLVNLLVEIKKIIPPWVRIMRIQREVEPKDIVSGPRLGNIRQLVLNKLQKEGIKCKCIRCREVGLIKQDVDFSKYDVELVRLEYNASGGKEIFLSFELKGKNLLLGFLRLRLMSAPLRAELRANSFDSKGNFRFNDEYSLSAAIVRELHVYGQVAKIENTHGAFNTASMNTNWFNNSSIRGMGDDICDLKDSEPVSNNVCWSGSTSTSNSSTNSFEFQHKGLGSSLLSEAEKICKDQFNLKSLSVISAVGTRDYYKKFGYTNNGPFVTKLL
ncbi:MAG: tRNA uridine(34) 5-carboxymethylaminomethyl modification radical SAM/GNAT enzyme Elp3 [Thermoproteota archaeon]|nr:tRNA uridine(34) 5-carboxymethylaminomethyl modification radical SAM/GNAT enzyme Elp3 [Thermoproteota archaeon]